MTLTALERYQPYWRLFNPLADDVTAAEAVSVAPPAGEDPLGKGIINVGMYNKIRIRGFGTTAALQTATFTIWGWHLDGTAQKVVTVAVILGSKNDHGFTTASRWLDDNIRASFTGTIYEVDTYTTPETYDENSVGTPCTSLANDYNYYELDLSKSQYQWLQMVTDCSGLLSAVTLGAIYLPVALKRGFGPLDIR